MRKTVKAPLALTALVISMAAASTAAHADSAPTAPPSQWTITGSADLATQYRFRGVAQSDNRPVVQGTFTIAHSSGFYLTTWGSSASATNSPVNIGGTEIDIYGGWTHALGKSGVTFDGGYYWYLYPGATAGNYYEFYASLAKTVGPVTAKAGINFAPAQKVFNINWISPSRSNAYIYGELGGAIPNTPLTIHTHLGHTGGGFDFPKQYIDYTVGVTAKWKALSFDASLVGTNMTRSDFAATSLPGYCEASFCSLENFYRTTKPVGVFTVAASF